MGHVTFVPPALTFAMLPVRATCRRCTRRELSTASRSCATSSAPSGVRRLRRTLPFAPRNERRQQFLVKRMTVAAEPPSSPGTTSKSTTPSTNMQVEGGVDCGKRNWLAQEDGEHNVHEAQVDVAIMGRSSQSEARLSSHGHVHDDEPAPMHDSGKKKYTARGASRVRRRSSNVDVPLEQTATDADTLVSPPAFASQLSTADQEDRSLSKGRTLAKRVTGKEKREVARPARARRQRHRRRRDRAMAAARKKLVKQVGHLCMESVSQYYFCLYCSLQTH